MVTATVDAGARTVIGFENSVYSTACNRWCMKFFEYYVTFTNQSGKTIMDVCVATDKYMQNDILYEGYDGDRLISLKNFVVCGEITFPTN